MTEGEAMIKYHEELKSVLEKIDVSTWNLGLDLMKHAWQSNRNVWIAGNGGNFANSLHFATDWNKGLFFQTGKPMKARVISEGIPTFSAFANDFSFEKSFQKSYEMFAEPNDVVVAMTGGGSSPNIVNLVNFAKLEVNASVVLLTGGSRSRKFETVDVDIHVPTQTIQIAEDIHATFGHSVLCYILESL
jgi:D-sedoheptulose 7-phosphate isomerase